MKNLYFGTKQIIATAMTRLAYNQYRDWDLPNAEDGTDAGYLVEYVDGGAPNHPDHEGYISWSPADVFERAYQSSDAMSFGHAIEAMKLGHKVARSGWNGKGMWVEIQTPTEQSKMTRPYLYMCIPNGTTKQFGDQANAERDMVPWLASQTDMLADDWGIV